MFTWSDESILWYRSAMEWTNYHVLLGAQLAEFFHTEDEVFDIGCGMGYQSVVLAPLVKHITSVDVEPRVLNILRDRAAAQGITNITPLEADWRQLKENCCDTVFACSFGTLERDFSGFMMLARKRLIIVKRNGLKENSGFVTKYSRFNGANNDEVFLESQGIPHRIKSFQADFGQPLRDREEAARFVEHYKLRPEEQSLDQYLDQYMLTETSGTYRYYLPNFKEVHILVIEKADVHTQAWKEMPETGEY